MPKERDECLDVAGTLTSSRFLSGLRPVLHEGRAFSLLMLLRENPPGFLNGGAELSQMPHVPQLQLVCFESFEEPCSLLLVVAEPT
jgi:hypothetical protein